MSSIDTRTNYKGETFSYAESRGARSYYTIQARADRIQRELIRFCEPMVECGFGAEQIRAELHMRGERLVTLGQIESVVSIIVGEQA